MGEFSIGQAEADGRWRSDEARARRRLEWLRGQEGWDQRLMDASEAADTIRELAEERAAHAERERFRTRAAIAIAVLAMLLAIASLGGAVLGSVSIVAVSRPVLWLALGLGAVAVLLMLNGVFLFVPLPG